MICPRNVFLCFVWFKHATYSQQAYPAQWKKHRPYRSCAWTWASSRRPSQKQEKIFFGHILTASNYSVPKYKFFSPQAQIVQSPCTNCSVPKYKLCSPQVQIVQSPSTNCSVPKHKLFSPQVQIIQSPSTNCSVPKYKLFSPQVEIVHGNLT